VIDHATLTRRQLVAAKITRGALPCVGHERAVIGPGRGCACHACNEPVLCTQIQISASFRTQATLRLHVDCFAIWRVAIDDLAG
jgi:hypothetical protein